MTTQQHKQAMETIKCIVADVANKHIGIIDGATLDGNNIMWRVEVGGYNTSGFIFRVRYRRIQDINQVECPEITVAVCYGLDDGCVSVTNKFGRLPAATEVQGGGE